ncbi:MAG: hypothetical protein WBD74_04815 [Candidatus Aquilonibacter sp.]
MIRSLRILIDAIALFALLALFALAIDRGWHWAYWRIPVLTLAVYLFSWTLERFPERKWVHLAIVAFRVVIVLAACWAEIHVAR